MANHNDIIKTVLGDVTKLKRIKLQLESPVTVPIKKISFGKTNIYHGKILFIILC